MQETFRTYLSCLFFVSSRDSNALAELSQLGQVQHAQQVYFIFIFWILGGIAN